MPTGGKAGGGGKASGRYGQRPEVLDLQAEMRDRLGELTDKDGAEAALLELTYARVARLHGVTGLTPADRRLILENHASATEETIAQRALDADGLNLLASLMMVGLRIGLDYSPLSHAKGDQDADAASDRSAGRALAEALARASSEAIESGLTSFGVLAITVLNAVHEAVHRDGMPWPKVARVLVNSMELAMSTRRATPAEAAGRAVEALARHMGITKAAARRYARMAEDRGLVPEGTFKAPGARSSVPKKPKR